MCHVLFIAAVQYTPSSEVATTPPAGSTELPMCPVCIGELTVLYFCFSVDSAIQFIVMCTRHHGVTFEFML